MLLIPIKSFSQQEDLASKEQLAALASKLMSKLTQREKTTPFWQIGLHPLPGRSSDYLRRRTRTRRTMRKTMLQEILRLSTVKVHRQWQRLASAATKLESSELTRKSDILESAWRANTQNAVHAGNKDRSTKILYTKANKKKVGRTPWYLEEALIYKGV